MKTLSFEYASLTLPARRQTVLETLFAYMTDAATALTSKLSNFLTRIQINRLISALSAMSDEHLDTIGVARKDIKKHALRMIRNT